MKLIGTILLVFGIIFQISAQDDFLAQAKSKICEQINRDDVGILRIADSLFKQGEAIEDLTTLGYLYYWKALGHFHSSLQPLDSVAKYVTKSQAYFLKVNDKEGLFETHTLLGKNLLFLSDWENAERHFTSAKKYADTDLKKVRNKIDFGTKHIFEDRIDSAFVFLETAEKMFPLLETTPCWYNFYKAELNINLGMAEIRRLDYENTDYKKSIQYFNRAIRAYNLSENKGIENYLFCLINLSYCYRKSGFFGVKSVYLDSARIYLSKYIDLVEKSEVEGKFGKLETAYSNLGWQLHAEGKSNEGIYHVQRSRDYLDSMYSDLLEKRALEITNSFENQIKDQEINYLNESNRRSRNNLILLGSILGIFFASLVALFLISRKLIQKNKRLQQQQDEIISIKTQLEVLLFEIHHRIKNNLQVISSFLGIQKRKLKQRETVDALSQSQARLQTIAVLHEQLYEQKGLEEVAMKPYFIKLIDHLKENIYVDKEVDFQLNIRNHVLNAEQSLYLGIILNELVTNAFKYAFDNTAHKTITVNFKVSPVEYTLSVADNGKGMPKESAVQSSGMGYQIINAMAEKLKGKIEIRSEKGTQIVVTVPR